MDFVWFPFLRSSLVTACTKFVSRTKNGNTTHTLLALLFAGFGCAKRRSWREGGMEFV